MVLIPNRARARRPRVPPDLMALRGAPFSAWVRAAVAASGLSQRAFSERVLVRPARSLTQWLSGQQPSALVERRVKDYVRKATRRANDPTAKENPKRTRRVTMPDGTLDPAIARGVSRAPLQAQADLAAVLLGGRAHVIANRPATLAAIRAAEAALDALPPPPRKRPKKAPKRKRAPK